MLNRSLSHYQYQRAWCYEKQRLLKAYRYECQQMRLYYQTWRILLWYAHPSHPIAAHVWVKEYLATLITALTTTRARAHALWQELESLPPLTSLPHL
jgi:hypothetical protein